MERLSFAGLMAHEGDRVSGRIGLGSLTLKATFLPTAVGILLIVAGLGWLTYIYPPLAERLGPWAMAPGMIGEGVLTFWLLAAGVDPERWRAQSTRSKAGRNDGTEGEQGSGHVRRDA